MCLIFLKPKNAKNYLTYERFCNALENNPHSIGIVFRNDKGIIEIRRYVNPEKGKKEIYDIIADKKEFAIHFRYTTHGGTNLYNCHPFIVNKDLCLMHNGVMSDFGHIDESKSDTRAFTEYFLRPYIEQEGIGVIKDKQFIEDVGKVVGSYNKILLIDKDFNWSIINESSGIWKEGCWMSNSHSTESSRSYYTSYVQSKPSNNNYYDDYDDYYSYYDSYYNYPNDYLKYQQEQAYKQREKEYNNIFNDSEKMKKIQEDPFGYVDEFTGEVYSSND